MTGTTAALALAVFAASAVETVEAVTIVLASGVTRGWRSALEGAASALVFLAVLVAIFGPLVVRAPLAEVRVVIGAILLIYGTQWLRKAILRAGGVIPKHDEDAIYAREVEQLKTSEPSSAGRRDRIGFTVAFKGVFLEGFEIVVIVVTLGSTGHHLVVAALAGLAAVVLVTGVGAILSRQLSEVPENALKMFVGILLVSFGSFWLGEGLGVRWPGSDAAIPVLAGCYAALAAILTALTTQMRSRAGQGAIGTDGR
jgi:Ca2+/H+ antiporter, TMEM165/GDT1 family